MVVRRYAPVAMISLILSLLCGPMGKASTSASQHKGVVHDYTAVIARTMALVRKASDRGLYYDFTYIIECSTFMP